MQRSNNEYERDDVALGAKPKSEYELGDIALGAVKPKNEYGQLIPPGTDYADASVLQ